MIEFYTAVRMITSQEILSKVTSNKKVMRMFFLFLTAMIICFVVGTTLLVKGTITVGVIAIGAGIVVLLFILIYYGKKKHRKKKYDWTPDCDCIPDFDCGPDCN